MQTFFNWLVVSSANPDKISLFLKGALGALVTVATMAAGLASIPVGDLTPVVDAIIALVQALALVVTSAVALYGFIRKTWRTIQGTHEGLQ